MVKKKKRTSQDNELYVLPSPSDEMRTFVSKFKVDMMEHVVSSIKFAIENKLPLVEVFQFCNSPFVITISEKEYAVNLDHISKYYTDNGIFELTPRVEALRQILKTQPDEKEKPDNRRPDKPES